MKNTDACPTCDTIPCRCPRATGQANDNNPSEKQEKQNEKLTRAQTEKATFAVEIIATNPHLLPLPKPMRESHENVRLKDRYQHVLVIGVYLEEQQCRYYFFNDRYQPITPIYRHLFEVEKEVPSSLKGCFQSQPHLYLMGHGNGGLYGICGYDSSESILDASFDRLIDDIKIAFFKNTVTPRITLESCSSANRHHAESSPSFIEHLSNKHKDIIFSGSTPWNPEKNHTGYRASGGFPNLMLPITSMIGSTWKNGGNVTVFFHQGQQLLAKKSPLSNTASSMALKINTVNYAQELASHHTVTDTVLETIYKSSDILRITDLQKLPELSPFFAFKNETLIQLENHEVDILHWEKARYFSKLEDIIKRFEQRETPHAKEALTIALCLQQPALFDDHADLYRRIMPNKTLLECVMIASGKVLIANSSNHRLIDLLLSHQIDINTSDHNGMNALHFAVHAFYVYEQEPLALIDKLIHSGANINARDNKGRTPLLLALEFGHATVAKKLVEKGANTSICDHDGRTPARLLQALPKNDEYQALALLLTTRNASSIMSHSSLWKKPPNEQSPQPAQDEQPSITYS